jgi:biotin operon repressor
MTAQGDFAVRDLVHVQLGRGRDRAESIGSLAERLQLTRRAVEAAVQSLRLDGIAVASGSEGIWLGDAADMAATASMLLGRFLTQKATYEAVQATAERLAADGRQLTWTDAA